MVARQAPVKSNGSTVAAAQLDTMGVREISVLQHPPWADPLQPDSTPARSSQAKTTQTPVGLRADIRAETAGKRAVVTTAVGVGSVEGQPTTVLNRKRWERSYVAGLQITDTVVVLGAVILAVSLRFGLSPMPSGPATLHVMGYSALIAILWILALAASHARSPRVVGAGIEEYRKVLAASLWTFCATALAELILKLEIARGYLAFAFPVGIVGLLLSRWIWRRYVERKRLAGRYQTAVLAIGSREAVANIANELTRNPRDGYQVLAVGIPGYGRPRGEYLVANDQKIPIVGGEDRALEAIDACGVDTVALAGTEHVGVQGIRKLIWKLEPMGVDLVVSPGVVDVACSRLMVRPVAGLQLLHIAKPQYQGAMQFGKRAFDFCFASAALTVSLPILLVIAAAVKIDSRGPIFYSSERIGIDGKPFYMLKFRTMVKDADRSLASLLDFNESDGLLFKIRDDPRITRVGRVLRRFSIDELPQFVNVLRQEMSVVGPRPPLRREVEAYDGDLQRRLLVRPGITGLWQVGGRSDLSWDDAVRLDLSYVDNWSMSADLVIILKTLRAVLQHKGAY
ncbi:MAG: polyprenyl glycosylphosphotransferase [Mycobacterium sp.]|nr:polyprenyl glycosylphosphotransferase [Mycobacterium sp.]